MNSDRGDLLKRSPILKEEIIWEGKTLSFETGRVARQAHGAVLVDYGGTVVLCTVVSKEGPEDLDFLALSVHYQEKFYANGKIPGGFLKRESKPSDGETLSSRLIDRGLRPLFPKGFHHEIQVICSVLSYSPGGDPVFAAFAGACQAILLSGLPFFGPVCGVRVVGGRVVGGEDWKINPERALDGANQENSQENLDLFVTASRQGVVVIESEAREVPEETIFQGMEEGLKAMAPILDFMEAFQKKWEAIRLDPSYFSDGRKAHVEETQEREGLCKKLSEAMAKTIEEGLEKILPIGRKEERGHALEQFSKETLHGFVTQGFDEALCKSLWKTQLHKAFRAYVLKKNTRLDGRAFNQIRSVSSEVGILPRVHGSALFTRGGTQSLCVVTLGSKEDGQLVEGFGKSYRETFMLHYNFPPFSVGEVGRVGAPGRREVGHGNLAKKAFKGVMPSQEDFPYVVRLVSEITESDGSSSMATVCGGSLALMDAGVQISRPVSGIAMGLIMEEGYPPAILSDIMGEEDGFGDIDFKVAGTEIGVTALQMDTKIPGVPLEVLKVALEQAREGRLWILKTMTDQTLAFCRSTLNVSAPRVLSLTIDKDKIRDLIGPGGKVIREICDSTGVKIDISDDGYVKVFAESSEKGDLALERIREISGKPEVGKIYQGVVKTVTDFGIFVKFFGPQEGLVHISELSEERVEDIRQFVQVGDQVPVKVLGFDDRGRIKLSVKRAKAS